ncbi:MAG: hypothetical protein PVJ57_09775 [Phycisphaerae bacterium]|jgi:hypothetical protein
MNADFHDERVDPQAKELLRLACDETGLAGPSDGLRARLEADERLRTDLEQKRALVRELRDALTPEPLPSSLRAEIDLRLDEQAGGTRTLVLPPYRIAGLVAAAAALVLVVLAPPSVPTQTNDTATAVTLTAEDVTDIADAFALMAWNGSVDYSLEQVSADVADLDERLEQRAEAGGGLPWSADDDWDAPREDHGTGQTTPPAADEICRGVRPGKGVTKC